MVSPRGIRLPIPRALLPSLCLACTVAGSPVARPQTPALLPTSPAQPPTTQPKVPPAASLPDSPGAQLPDAPARQVDVVVAAKRAFRETGDPVPTLTGPNAPMWHVSHSPGLFTRIQQERYRIVASQRFLDTEMPLPMTSRGKAFIAATDIIDPGNLAVIALSSGIYVASNPQSPYGPGFPGFGRNLGYSLSQDTTGEFFGTWLIPSLAHQDPRYHRMPGAPLGKRLLHAISHTVISQSDTGRPIPNYATLLTYPIAAAIANTYVPGLQRNVPATTQRVLIGLASDPSDALIGEFLPDVARRIHIRVTFFQRIINDYSTDRP